VTKNAKYMPYNNIGEGNWIKLNYTLDKIMSQTLMHMYVIANKKISQF